jgi:CheY-like chemotaxis protein
MPKRVLIVDDNQTVRNTIRNFLTSRTALEVCGEAADGSRCIGQGGKPLPGLILLDMAMPDMNGLETARQLRLNSVNVPIILFTNYSDALRPDVATAAGINAVVLKSNTRDLMQRIEDLLGIGSRKASA